MGLEIWVSGCPGSPGTGSNSHVPIANDLSESYPPTMQQCNFFINFKSNQNKVKKYSA